MRYYHLIIVLWPLVCSSQSSLLTQGLKSDYGILWKENISWQQVLAQAKAESKYIFVDCFATWCAPCQLMDNKVYVNYDVGKYFNENFISIKIQVNKTSKDTKSIRAWYQNADLICKQYKVKAYPTYLFFNPNGELIHKEEGYKNVSDFLDIGKEATKPGKKYVDEYLRYDQLVSSYKHGIKDYSTMLYMFNTAVVLGDSFLVRSLLNEYYKYLLTSGDSMVYSKANIEFIATYTRSTKNKMFNLFLKDAHMIDSIMERPGYSKRISDKLIQNTELNRILQPPSSRNDTIEPVWNDLILAIQKKYNLEVARRVVFDAKVKWYGNRLQFNDHSNLLRYMATFIENVVAYGTDTTDLMEDLDLNAFCWEIVFKHSYNETQINTAIKLMEGVVRRFLNRPDCPPDQYFDTYANLLYRVGRVKEAIKWEEQAIKSAIEWKRDFKLEAYYQVLNDMENGRPTWPM